MKNLNFIGIEDGEESKLKKKLDSLVLLIHPPENLLEVRKIGSDYHVSPQKYIVGYNFNTDCDQRCFSFGLGIGGQQVGVADKETIYYFHLTPFPDE